MKKNTKVLGILVAAAVMMTAVGCSSKSGAPADSTEVTTEAVTTTAPESTTTGAESADTSEETDTENTDLTDEMEEETETTASPAGTVGSDGAFKAASGKYDITVPEGWTVADGGDDKYVTFYGADENDMIEVINVTGKAAEREREVYPESGDEYLNLVSRGDEGAQMVSYDVKNGSGGSQTFKYTMKFTNPSDGIRYIAVSGSYDAASGKYSCVTGYAATEGAEKQVQTAVDSYKIK